MEAEEQADMAATEIVDLVEQEVQRSAGPLTGASLSPGMHIPAHSIATDTMERLAYAAQKEEAAIPKWVNYRKLGNEPRGDATSPIILSRPGGTTGR